MFLNYVCNRFTIPIVSINFQIQRDIILNKLSPLTSPSFSADSHIQEIREQTLFLICFQN